MSKVNSDRFGACDTIRDFYRARGATVITSAESTGPFGGKRVFYLVKTDAGNIKVECNCGLDTMGFAALALTAEGFVSGHIGRDGGSIGSQGKHFFATSIGPVDENGVCEFQTIFTTAKLQLPCK